MSQSLAIMQKINQNNNQNTPNKMMKNVGIYMNFHKPDVSKETYNNIIQNFVSPINCELLNGSKSGLNEVVSL